MSAIAAPFPEPPQQLTRWTAPTFDAKVGAAAQRLFAQGVADPRGCEYRAIDIVITEGWDDAAKRVSTHGEYADWLVTTAPEQAQFAAQRDKAIAAIVAWLKTQQGGCSRCSSRRRSPRRGRAASTCTRSTPSSCRVAACAGGSPSTAATNRNRRLE